MPIWDLETGCGKPIIVLKGEQAMTTTGVGNLSPQEVARRAESWYGARVETHKHKIRIFPKDPNQKPVFISDRFSNGTDRSNALSWLRKAGIDVMTEPQTTREDPLVNSPKPTVLASKPSVNGVKPAGAPSQADYETVLAMLAEAEQRDQARRDEITQLGRTVDGLVQRLERLERLEHENRARYAAQIRLIKDLKTRVEEAGALPEDPAKAAERERAELTEKAIELLESLPSAATMASGSIAASLGMPEKGNLFGKLMATAAKEQRVRLLKVGSQKLYRALPKSE